METPKIVCLAAFNPAAGCKILAFGTYFPELQLIIAALYVSCPVRVLLGEQQVLSEDYSPVKQLYYTTSCRNALQW